MPTPANWDAKAEVPANGQTEAVWAEEAAKVVGAHRALMWKRPSRHDCPCSARNAGVEMVGAVDAWDIATRTYEDNFPTRTTL